MSDPLPKGIKGSGAEKLADEMLTAINASAFFKAQGASWQFRDHRYVWHKGLNRVRVQLDDELLIYIDLNRQQGWVLEDGQRPTDQEEEKDQVQEAIKLFNNDSFWAFAPFKIKDPGTQRAVVANQYLPRDQEEGKELANLKLENEALLIYYQSGGTTPGDHYLWYLDQNKRPTSWQMWVSIIPIGGLESTWSGWIKTQSGAWVAQNHHIGFLNLEIKNIQVVERFEELRVEDPYLTGDWSQYLSL